MKKFLGILCILSFLFVIAACDGKKADQKKVDEVYDWLELPNLTEELTNDSPRIIMPTEREGYTDVTITWEIDKPEYISYDGVITQPPHEEGDQTVTITATIKLNDIEKKKTFTGKVLALPPVTETPALLDETFKDYDDGELEPQTDRWSVVSGKAGTSKFTVVSSIEGVEIPEGSKALKVEAFTERTLEASIKHDYDIVVVEADLMQTASSDGTSIHLQSYYSSPQVAFGLNGKTLYYRVDNGEQLGITVELNKWYRARFEVDLKNKTIELFYYENGQLVAITPGKVPYSGTTSFQSFYIRTGSSTTSELKPPAYITNIRINRPEAMPRPEEEVKLGGITGIEDVNLVLGTEFQPAEPKVYNYYGTKRELVKDEDYVLEIIHEIDVNVPGDYEVVYKFTNKNDQNDVKQVKQIVTVYAEGDPNEIKSVESTQAIYPDWLTDVTVKLVQPAGTLYYYLSGNETETLETVLEGEQIEVDSENVVIENLAIGDSTYIHIVIFHNGYTDVFSHQLNRMNVLEISTPQEFYDAVFNADSKENYFLLTANLDFSEFEWQGLGPRFYGILDGNGYAISNLTINVPDSTKVGIFTELDGATIKNLVFDNVEIYSMKERAGILAGITTNHATNIENITVYGSKVVVGDSTTEGANHYAGLLLGRSEVSTVISNVYVRDSEVIVFGKYVGGLVGQVEKADLTIEDADVEIKVTEGLNSEVAGGIVGRNKGQLTLRRIIANVEVNGNKYLGGFVGMNDASNSSTKIFDSLITGSLVGGAADKGAGVICGYLKNGTVENENVWAVNFTGENEISHRITVDEDFIIESLDTVSVSVWWTENIPSIAESELWDTAGFATLIREEVVRYTITFVVEDYEIDPIQVRANQTAVLPEPAKEGYKFIGWFLDENYETPFDPETVITGDLTLYGKFEEITLPSYTVTFDTDGGSTIDSVTVYEGETVAKPNDPVKEGFEFAGWYKDFEYTEEFDFDTPVTGNITLYAKWDPLIKVTFVANGGQVFLGDEEINYIYLKPDSLLPELTVQKEGHNFGGWFVDEDLTEAFVLEAPITQDITLYAKWDEKAGITIETVEDFLAFLDNPQDETYVLNADLDFNGATVETSNKVFVGILDGQGHVISNLKLVAQDNYGGLFAGLNGATVKNLVFHNVEVVALARAGLLAGESKNEKVTVKNITAIDCRVFSGNDDTLENDIYAALIIGRARVETEIQNIKVVSSEVLVKGKYVGGLLGYAETKVDMSDIDAEIKVTEISTSSTAQLVGGIVGRVGKDGVLTLNRVIAKVDLTGWKNIGGLLGKNDGTAYVYDAVITGELKLLEGSSSKDLGAISGNKSFNETVNVWAVAVIGEGTGGNKQSAPEDKTLGSLEDVADSAWWQENMPNIAESELWDVTGGFAELVREFAIHTVSFVAEGVEIAPRLVLANTKVVLPVPEKAGFEFVGWFIDENHETPFDPETLITEDLTLYGKFEEIPLPTYKVSFDTDVGSEVEDQFVIEGNKATCPEDPTKEGFAFAGWFTDAEFTDEFDFDTPITGHITLFAKWNPMVKVVFETNGGTVKLDGKEISYLYVLPDELLLEELVVERKLHNFVGWFTDSDLTVAFDLETPITEEITLYAAWEEAGEPILIETADDFIAFLNDPQEKIYYLAADLDLTDKTYTPTSFSGILDGKGHTIRNLSFSGGDRSGLFTYIRGTVRNIVFEDVTINSSGRAGLIAGEIDVTGVLIENIVVKNLTVTGSQENGVAGLVAVIKDGAGSATFANISMENVTIINAGQKNAGAIVAYVRGKEATIIRDIHLKDVVVKAMEHVGGVVGCIKTTQPLSMDRVVLENAKAEGDNYVAGFVGRMYEEEYTGVTLTDVLIKGLEIVGSDKYNNVVTGRYEDIVMTSVFGGDFTLPGTSKDGQTVLAEIDDFTALDEAWFEDNLPALTEGLWSIVDGMPVLAVFPEE